MHKNKKIVGIVLSGGKSSRMGSEKGLVKWKEKPLIEYSLEAIQALCDTIVISSNKNCYDYLALPVVEDVVKGCGPIGGIYSCMNVYPADYYLVVSCDVPGVNNGLFNDLLNEIGDSKAIVPIDENKKVQPLVAVYSKNSHAIIKDEFLSGHLKMMKLLDKLSCKYLSVDIRKPYFIPGMFVNANSPRDLESL
jgi:molybdopterin-guanine dinucleotide biosynthesis protein A